MEPNNIENQIREKLNSREIQPSAQAWDRLDAMLTVGEEKKTKRSFFSFKYIGIAASVLVFVTLGLFYFNQKNTTIESQNTVVETERKETPNSNIQTPNLESRQIEEVAVSVKKEDYSQQTTDNRQPITNNNEVSIINQKNNQSNSIGTIINREKEVEYMIGEAIGIKDLPIIESSTKVFISKKSNSKKPTYIDVDELLSSVDNSNLPKAKTSIGKIKVDATTLLSNADNEVETSFREKIINRVSKNYKEVKVALSTRNQE
jgi:hypothetical protein